RPQEAGEPKERRSAPQGPAAHPAIVCEVDGRAQELLSPFPVSLLDDHVAELPNRFDQVWSYLSLSLEVAQDLLDLGDSVVDIPALELQGAIFEHDQLVEVAFEMPCLGGTVQKPLEMMGCRLPLTAES